MELDTDAQKNCKRDCDAILGVDAPEENSKLEGKTEKEQLVLMLEQPNHNPCS